jgi:hypothetical protein
MMDNDHFKHSFINIYCDLLNTIFQPNYLLSHLDSIANYIEDIIPVHRARWYNNGNWPNSAVNWQSRINTMENFSTNRRSYAINHIKNEFDLPNIAQTSLNIVPEGAGSIQLNTLKIIESGWNGYYFPTIPIEARAIPNEGFQFSSWLEFPDSNATIHVQVTDPFTLTAVFIPTNLSSGTTVINEINYNSSDDYNSDDWVELINPGETEIDVSDWILKDDDNSHGYTIPGETVIQPNNYLVLAKDMDLFSFSYPDINNVIGPFDFSLSGGGDQVRIFDSDGVLIDSVQYDDIDPWPVEPDGNGPTLELINPTLDNLLSESWAASTDNGTPGAQNSTYNNLSTDLKSIIPEKIHLYPSYPNPFNPITTISFDIPNTVVGMMNASSLHVFNIKGQRIETLLNETMKPGKHNIQWHPKNISSGVYFLQFKYGEEVITQKITFMK